MSKNNLKPKHKSPIKTRDYALLLLISGATKANIQPDRKKEISKRKARKKVELDEE